MSIAAYTLRGVGGVATVRAVGGVATVGAGGGRQDVPSSWQASRVPRHLHLHLRPSPCTVRLHAAPCCLRHAHPVYIARVATLWCSATRVHTHLHTCVYTERVATRESHTSAHVYNRERGRRYFFQGDAFWFLNTRPQPEDCRSCTTPSYTVLCGVLSHAAVGVGLCCRTARTQCRVEGSSVCPASVRPIRLQQAPLLLPFLLPLSLYLSLSLPLSRSRARALSLSLLHASCSASPLASCCVSLRVHSPRQCL